MLKTKYPFLIMALVIISVFIIPGCKKDADVIKLAVVAPLTGNQAEMGQDLVNGEKLASEEINAHGGILGKKLELIIMDDQADPTEAVTIANKLVVNKDVVGIVGHLNSGTTLPASAVYYKSGMPVVMPVPTNPKITQQGFNNLFRIPATDADQGPQAARFAFETLHKNKFVIIHDKTAYGQGIADEFKREAEKLGVKILLYDAITEGQTDFSAILTRIKSLNPEVFYFGGMYPEGGLLIKQARAVGINAIFMVGDGCYDPEFIKIGEKATEGSIISFLAPPWEEEQSTAEFAKNYESKYGKIKNYAPFGYDGVYIFAKAIKATGKADRKTIIDELRKPDFYLDGVVGKIEFKENGDNKNANLYFYQVKNGKFELFK